MDPVWDSVTTDPNRPSMQAGTLLAVWLAHDWCHIRQISDLQYGYLEKVIKPFGLNYAG